jgi:hypothetical protein
MKLYTVVVHYLHMCMKEYGCCPKFRRGDNSTYTLTKRGVTVVVHYLQMCKKKYCRCPEFGRGDNSTCTFTKRMYLVSATPPKQLIGFL